jgi:hypothetical protein
MGEGCRLLSFGCAALIGGVVLTAPAEAGTVTGQGRMIKIAGSPGAGYSGLFESDLFLSPSGAGTFSDVRRLGSPPGQSPTYDGFYSIGNVPAGNYSLYVNQPDFFISPKVVPNVTIPASGTVNVNLDLDVDYSTPWVAGNWTDWAWDNYQTFEAAGTSVRGVTWRMAGSRLYDNKVGQVSILEDNGNADPRQWKLVGWGNDPHVNADSDEWVRFTSGQVPLTPGKKYAVRVHVEGGMAVYKRDNDAMSYAKGTAHDENGAARPYDLAIAVFTDPADGGGDDTLVTHTRKSPGPGVGIFDGSLNDTKWGQSFVATGTSLAAVDMFAAGQTGFGLTWRVREGGPSGAQIGPTKTVQGAYFATTTVLAGVSFNPGEITLVPGRTYHIEATNSAGFTPYLQEKWNAYGDGEAYKNGTVRAGADLAMTIMEYGPGMKRERIAYTEFAEAGVGVIGYIPAPGAKEMGWVTPAYLPQGSNPSAGTANSVEAPTSPMLVHRGIAGTSEFMLVDLANWDLARVSMMVRVAETGYEDGDLLRIWITDGVSSVDLLNELGNTASTSDALEVLGDRAFFRIEGMVPESWSGVRLMVTSSSNSTQAAEFYIVDSVEFTGVAVPEPGALSVLCGVSFLLRRRIGLRRGRIL